MQLNNLTQQYLNDNQGYSIDDIPSYMLRFAVYLEKEFVYEQYKNNERK